MSFKRYAWVMGIAYVLLIGLSLVIAAFASDTGDEYAKIATVSVTIITGLATVCTSLFVAYRNSKLELEKQAINQAIEASRQSLSQELAEKSGALTLEIANGNKLFNQKLEKLKNWLSWSHKAYDELYDAATTLYHTLQNHAMGDADKEAVKTALTKMISAQRYLPSLKEAEQSTWMELWQTGKRISELFDGKPGEECQKIWSSEAAAFGDQSAKFKAIVQKHYAQLSAEADEPPLH